ncbi:MAG: hypothetical protein ABSB52_07415 [Acidimicrobiales bacterium]|jgi:hypothetical protein
MRDRLTVFAADVNRFGPLAVVSFATIVCLPSLLEFLSGQLAIASMLGRYCAALLFASLGVKAVSWVVLRYAIKNATEEQMATSHRSPDGASDRRSQ